MIKDKRKIILIDNERSKDPFYNLALEEALLRKKNDRNSYFLIYINTPSVVIGRHQNIYEEVNLKYCSDNNIPVLRRISGGGAVWHDSGNLNFSFINDNSPELVNNYQPFLQPIITVLREIGINAVQNEQNDLTLDGKKICGTAQFTSKNRMLTHGTLLFNADLIEARAALDSSLRPFYHSKSKKSRVSSIVNIYEYLNNPLTIEEFKEIFINLLRKKNVIKRIKTISNEIKHEAQLLQQERYLQWEWNYGRSPAALFERKMRFKQGYVFIRMKLVRGIFKEVAVESNFIEKVKTNRIENLFKEEKNDILSLEKISDRIKELQIDQIDWIGLLCQ